ncbi:hypothetical protein [Prauserella muralis]|uniref:Uncharacterized protein n=1 Tax=Prauserella muralis TaxID=588067 RepID=A0A2V4ADK1_9PSEU|nr:hypothetical protein [Prauserella muralis]PXY16580.1 hypothetical protein BAY60_35890 [Prauserella muralis]
MTSDRSLCSWPDEAAAVPARAALLRIALAEWDAGRAGRVGEQAGLATARTIVAELTGLPAIGEAAP